MRFAWCGPFVWTTHCRRGVRKVLFANLQDVFVNLLYVHVGWARAVEDGGLRVAIVSRYTPGL